MSPAMKKFMKDLAERAGKTFLQAYLAFWLLQAGLGGTPAEQPGSDAFGLLFTMDNVKAGVVALAFSIVTSLGSRPLGPDSSSASLVVSTDDPATPRA
jgi:hypothetical protein